VTAVYARQSADRPDSISIESQIEFCRYETRGEPFRVYADRGFSGKNTDRPAFKELLADVENGVLDRVLVYKLDRISRSILDFSAMMVKFESRRVEFVSSSEKFDTSSPMGRAMLNICIVFAQLERETIQKRVADAYYSRSRKSLYMGGRLPFGFATEPAVVGGVRTSRYVPVPEEAEQVRLIYGLYAGPDTSYGDIIRYFKDNGLSKNGRPWERARLADVLRNPVYVKADADVYEFCASQGAIIANPPEDFIGTNGCYCYSGNEAGGRKRAGLAGSHLVLAPHEGLVDSETWLKCREKCLQNGQATPRQKAKNTWLAGRIKCGVCGYALVEKRYPTRKGRYLLCSRRSNAHACGGPGTVCSGELEELISALIKEKLAELPALSGKQRGEPNPEAAALNAELAGVNAEIGSLMEKLPGANETVFRYINARIEELDGRKNEIASRVRELEAKKPPEPGQLAGHVECWDRLDFDDRREAVFQLIGAIRATSEKIVIEWKI